MKRISILFIIIAFFAQLSTIDAQGRPSKAEREKWFKEMREYKHCFLTKELELTEDQQKEFFPLYDAMEDECHKINRDTRRLQRSIMKKEASEVTDIEYEKAAEALYELKGKEAIIELNYLDKFKSVLTKKQLFLLKSAEDKFSRHLMKEHSKHSKKGKKDNDVKSDKD